MNTNEAPSRPIPGRGASINPPNRFERLHLAPDPEAAAGDPAEWFEEPLRPRTEFYFDASESILSPNDSPDLPFTYALNPYRGCEHGCSYCYARPYHEYLGFSGGLDFETRIMVKLRAPELLRRELAAPGWQPQNIAFSGVTDCYQPAERRFRLTRACLEVCREFHNPIAIVTKSALVVRDRDVLGDLARLDAAAVFVSVTSLDAELAGRLEPRAARPEHRLRAIRELSHAGIPVGVMVAPIIPGLTDHEMPAILGAAAAAGATHAGYTILRLPHSVKSVFQQWLRDHAPTKQARILSRLRDLRGGRLTTSTWGRRLHGEGVFAEQIRALFHAAARRAGLQPGRLQLSTAHFRRPGGTQLGLGF